MTLFVLASTGVVNYVSTKGQSATEKAEEVVKEMLQAGQWRFRSAFSVSVSILTETALKPSGPLALRAAKTAIDIGAEVDLYAHSL